MPNPQRPSPVLVAKPARSEAEPACLGLSVVAKLRSRLVSLFSTGFWGGRDQQWYGALAVSTVLHLCLISWLAGLWIGAGGRDVRPIESRWSAAESNELSQIDAIPPLALTTERLAGGAQGGDVRLHPDNAAAVAVAESASETTVPVLPALGMLPSEAAAEQAGAATFAEKSETQFGAGRGDGRGDGQGRGDGFFGIHAPGKRFVYVVDCSASMNLPHDSEYKTRFRRLKVELVRSIGMMDSSMSFFVIFFNQDALPMPARELQPAVPRLQKYFLEWCAKMKATGGTNPRDAMQMALRMQPDVIFFLTDGSFSYRVTEELKSLKQSRIVIHTFAFGDPEGEEILKEIAENNGGEYKFVP
jgi:hypothetical protein